MRLVTILGAVGAAATSTMALASAPLAADHRALESLFLENDRAWNAQDPAALSQLYTSDGTARLGYATKPVAGQQALHQFFRIALSSAPGTRHVTRVESVEMVQSDTALIDAEVSLDRATGDGNWQIVQKMRSNVVAVRQNGRWKLHSVRAHPQASAR